MNTLTFAAPAYAHLGWLVLGLCGALLWLQRRGGGALARFIDPAMQPRLVRRVSRRRQWLGVALLALCGACLTLALMRPQWGETLVESQRASADIMILLDVSRSMLAEDVAPSRLGRAKADLRDLLALLDGDRVGLIAFAGRAAVLSPLTPDLGFVQLAIDDAGPHSVGRGGTRLEAPIRKALAGFGERTGAARSILLITDGEDHDSFPREAAQAAAERGIRIIAIGFGAEGGSPIRITDPRTGAKRLVRDADGQVVQTRLDGELLRDMALATDGAYIPAGTGVLDLGAIHERHIAPLTRERADGVLRTARHELYPWALLPALLALLGALACTAFGSARPLLVATLALVLLPAAPGGVRAEPAAPPAEIADDPPPSAIVDDPRSSGQATAAGESSTLGPQAAYNAGLDALESGDTAAATRLFESARSRAGDDAELHFRATYNLGWAQAEAAEPLLEQAPEQALEALQRAAGWFQQAVARRPEHEDARANLEIISRRIARLADALAEREDNDLEARLQALIAAQREFVDTLRQQLEAMPAAPAPGVADAQRESLRELAAQQLLRLTQADEVGDAATREHEALADDAGDGQAALRRAQIDALLGHLHRARERLGQARAQLRRGEGERAHRRASAALDDLLQARDQLLDPMQRLDALSARQAALTAQTPAPGTPAARGPAPPWRSTAWLEQAQRTVEQRTTEVARLLAAAQQGAARSGSGTAPPAQATLPARDERLLRRIRAALPAVNQAESDFANAAAALADSAFRPALQAQQSGLAALARAREQFLDLRGLIELATRQQQAIAQGLQAPPDEKAMAEIRQQQARNVTRAGRLSVLLDEAEAEAEADAAAAPGEGAAATDGDAVAEHMARARALRAAAEAAMRRSAAALASDDGSAAEAASEAADTMEELRRLFFSLLEHLRELAVQQQGLGARTANALAQADETAQPSAPGAEPSHEPATGDQVLLAAEQEMLGVRAGGLADAFDRQAAQAPAPDPDPSGQPGQPDPEKLAEAAGLIREAAAEMQRASSALTAPPRADDTVTSAQAQALARLQEALALFAPPPDPQQQDSPDNGDPSQQQDAPQPPVDGNGGSGSDAGAPAPEDAAQREQIEQLLQGVREREAERRAENARQARPAPGYAPVERDW